MMSEERIPIQLSMDDPEPMYRQIESQLRDFILSGYLLPGTRLPSVRGLASELACSVITTRRAYQDLENDGFIRTRQGVGAVVAELDESEMNQHQREPIARAFLEAVDAGRRAGLSDDELSRMFDEALQGGNLQRKTGASKNG